MKLRKKPKAQKRLAARISEYEAMCKSDKDHGKGFTKPGSLKK